MKLFSQVIFNYVHYFQVTYRDWSHTTLWFIPFKVHTIQSQPNVTELHKLQLQPFLWLSPFFNFYQLSISNRITIMIAFWSLCIGDVHRWCRKLSRLISMKVKNIPMLSIKLKMSLAHVGVVTFCIMHCNLISEFQRWFMWSTSLSIYFALLHLQLGNHTPNNIEVDSRIDLALIALHYKMPVVDFVKTTNINICIPLNADSLKKNSYSNIAFSCHTFQYRPMLIL